MAKTFFPEESVFIKAEHPGDMNVEYKISIGQEEWGTVSLNP